MEEEGWGISEQIINVPRVGYAVCSSDARVCLRVSGSMRVFERVYMQVHMND